MTKDFMSRQGVSDFDRPHDTRQTVVFLGAPLNCAERMLKVLAAEFTDTAFLRVPNLNELAEMTRQNRHVCLVILEERDISMLLDRPFLFFSAAGEAQIVLAYRSGAVAKTLLDAAERDPRLASVSLLPLEVHMEVWISVTRLLLLGVRYVPAALSRAPAPQKAAPPDANPAPPEEAPAEPVLTRREMEVLRLAATGLQNKNIAARLTLSEHTVKLHMHHVLSKLGVDNRTAATHWYLDQRPQTRSEVRGF